MGACAGSKASTTDPLDRKVQQPSSQPEKNIEPLVSQPPVLPPAPELPIPPLNNPNSPSTSLNLLRGHSK